MSTGQIKALPRGAWSSLLLCALAGGCGDQPGSAEAPHESTEAAEEAPPSFEVLLAAAKRLPDGHLIIDQDILVEDEAAARAYYDRHVAQPSAGGTAGQLRQGLTVKQTGGVDTLWPLGQRMDLTYCVDTASFGANATRLLQALDEATYYWSSRVGVAYRRVTVPTCDASANVLFNVRQVTGGAFFGSAFFPDEGRSVRELRVDTSAFTTTSGGRDLTGILTHELGHTLGARHEHIWVTCTGETTSDARAVTPYDVNSVMHYPQCRPGGSGGYRPTEQDYTGMNALYGMSPALIMNING